MGAGHRHQRVLRWGSEMVLAPGVQKGASWAAMGLSTPPAHSPALPSRRAPGWALGVPQPPTGSGPAGRAAEGGAG